MGDRDVPDRLTAQDASFLYVEQAAAPMHVGTVAIFAVLSGGFDVARLTALVEERLPGVPRFRQRVRSAPANLANPVWVDDAHFDLDYHLRRSILPRPGSVDQLRELVARVQSRPLERRRPLWEMYVVEGLSAAQGVRIALITKTHQALVDGVTAVDLGQLILDPDPDTKPGVPRPWQPAPEPSWAELMTDAVTGIIRNPGRITDAIRRSLSDLRATAARLAGPAAPASPLNVSTGAQRRFSTVRTDLEEYRRIRAGGAQNGRGHGRTVNDVILTVVTGALRAWLLSRGESVDRSAYLRALVPVSVRTGQQDGREPQRGVASYFVDLPIGEPDPAVRLHQIGHRMQAHNLSGQRIGADALSGLSGFAPPTLHALGARVAGGLSRRTHNLVITNVPGPQEPRYTAGAKLLESYPVVPIVPGQALAVGATSYLGQVCYGLNADRDALPDVGVVAQCIDDALAELAAATLRKGLRR